MKDIFDDSRIYYAYRENYYHWGNGPIYDDLGNIIAKYHHHRKPERIELLDLNNEIIYNILKTKKLKFRLEIRDNRNNFLYRIRKKSSNFIVENVSEERVILANSSGEFFNNNMQNIALRKVTRTWPNIFRNVIFEFFDTIGIKIINPVVDRRALIGLVLALDWRGYLLEIASQAAVTVY